MMKTKMLNKIKVIAILGLVMGVVRGLVPDFDTGGEFQAALEGLINAIFVLIPIGAGWFVRETRETTEALVLK